MIRALIASFVLVAAVACGEKPATSDKPRDSAAGAAAQPASAASTQPATDPANATAPPPAAGVPADRVAADSAPATSSGEITGKVLETMDSGGYTYIKLDAGGGEVWAAVNQAPVKKGQTVTVVNAVQMDGFESKTLHRKFDHILFGSLAQPGANAVGAKGGSAAGNATAPKESALPPGHPKPGDDSMQKMVAAQHAAAGMGAGAKEVGKIEVAKAGGADGHTVAEVFAKKAALKDKPVEVRGKVVKFLPQIMGKNWIHLRDGSGSSEKKNNDLTVTTKDSANVGDVVVVRGTVKVDRDLGAGYQYPVLIEEAKVSK